MDKVAYQKINETLYKEVLPNGLTVYLLPKAGYHKHMGCSVPIMAQLTMNLCPVAEQSMLKFLTVSLIF